MMCTHLSSFATPVAVPRERVFLWSYLRTCLNEATEILIFNHFLGTDIATLTEKARTVNDKVSIKVCS